MVFSQYDEARHSTPRQGRGWHRRVLEEAEELYNVALGVAKTHSQVPAMRSQYREDGRRNAQTVDAVSLRAGVGDG